MTKTIVIGGPTASGKSGLALALAERLDGVIINADSMQVYRGLPLLTAQPDASDMTKAPHRLYAALEASETCSAARWRDMALVEIETALAQGKTPIIVGGTGFYLSALLEGLSPIPKIAPRFREEAIALQRQMGNPAFHAHLTMLDPETAAGLDPLNTQRVARAYEVLTGTGQGLAQWQKEPRIGPPAHLLFATVALLPPRDVLYAACDARFTCMMERGALAEVEAFRPICPPGAMLAHALGYAELCVCLDGEISQDEAMRLACQDTRNYAKRQMTWFRNQFEADMVTEMSNPIPILKYYEI